MSDGPALLRAILSEPDDDTPRLVYADWLEERDETQRAELIRAQVELARDPKGRSHRALRQRVTAILGRPNRSRPEWALADYTAFSNEDGLLDWEWQRGFPEVWHCPVDLWMAIGPAIACNNPVTRVVTSSASEGALTGPSLFRRSWYRDNDSRWANPPDAKSIIPAAIFDLLPADPFDMEMFGISNTYPSAECASAALSEACVEYARFRAGLPSLAAVR